ncbi:hypothetical protein L1M14_02815 [Actinobacillus suis]|uniref:hypothetical protein n=1 Tax=Actinobacillus suis TaxID=716 RepID=UPI00207D1D05|nr:hypothetical protein [Actinobacillus suis]MCO4166432.1 hypothetical protein [Actinobacillus suis]
MSSMKNITSLEEVIANIFDDECGIKISAAEMEDNNLFCYFFFFFSSEDNDFIVVVEDEVISSFMYHKDYILNTLLSLSIWKEAALA